MDLQKYFAELEVELISLGMSEAQSKAYCKRLSSSLAVLDEKARNEKLASYGSATDLAKRVIAIAVRPASSSAENAPETSDENANKEMEHTVNVGTAAPAKKRDDVTRAIPTMESEASEENQPYQTSDSLQATKKKLTVVKVVEEEPKKEKKPLSRRGMAVFFGSAILTSPITLGIVGAIIGAFLFTYVALIVLAVTMFVAVTATVIAGILLALVCMGYGVVKMLPGTDAFFIGLYEFGLGMIMVGGTIVFPILEYNLATVFVPFCMKKLYTLLKFTIRQVKRLIVYLFDRCRDL